MYKDCEYLIEEEEGILFNLDTLFFWVGRGSDYLVNLFLHTLFPVKREDLSIFLIMIKRWSNQNFQTPSDNKFNIN